MRIIKFRGKRINGCAHVWVYGNLIQASNGIYIEDENEEYSVIPETVGQYTGLQDKKRTKQFPNGQPIYEGDICQNISGLKWGISWDEEDARFYMVYVAGECGVCRMNKEWIWETDLEVIGNIHDNHELLEVVE